jgi:hypothetical protein
VKQPTRAEWNRLKEQRGRVAPDPQQASESAGALPDDLFLPDDYVDPAATTEDAERPHKRRQFRRFDETWAEKLLPLMNPLGRLALVLLAEADFHQHIKATSETARAAGLTLKQQSTALARLERLGLASVERRGRGRPQIATPLRLAGRPRRR